MRAKSQCFSGSLWREGSLRESCGGKSEVALFSVSLWRDGGLRDTCAGESEISVFRWLAKGRRQFTRVSVLG